MIDKTKFLATDDDPRYYLHKPFNAHGKTIYSNGHVMICEPMIEGFDSAPSTLKVEKIIKGFDSAEFQKPDWPPLPEKHACQECDGTGIEQDDTCPECDGDQYLFFSNDFNSYRPTCKTCGGYGKARTKKPTGNTCNCCYGTGKAYQYTDHITVAGIDISPTYAELIMHDPDVEVSPNTIIHQLMFRSGPLAGVIMGMRI